MTSDDASHDEIDAAAVRIPPPLIFAAAISVALVLGRIWPRDPFVGGALGWIVGVSSIAGGIALLTSAARRFQATQQDPKPSRPTPAVVTDGPYALSRNPMYLGLVMMTVGIGYIVGNGWFPITGVMAALVVQKTAIEHEEAYLERKFGETYRAYKRRVRRWV